MRWLLAPFRLIYRVVRRFFREHMVLMASALSFDTLLGLVPMIAVGLSLPTHFPVAGRIVTVFQNFVVAHFLPESSGPLVAHYLGQFAQRAENVPLVGGIALLLIALLQTLTIEYAFNSIWNIHIARPFFKRVLIHGLTLLIGPLVFGGSLALISLTGSISLGLVDEPIWLASTFYSVLPNMFTAILFSVLYWAVPFQRVFPLHAMIGGVFAALGFSTLQYLFGLYVANFSLYAMLYGAFSAIPIFLAWLFFSWSLVLVGALVVSELPRSLKST